MTSSSATCSAERPHYAGAIRRRSTSWRAYSPAPDGSSLCCSDQNEDGAASPATRRSDPRPSARRRRRRRAQDPQRRCIIHDTACRRRQRQGPHTGNVDGSSRRWRRSREPSQPPEETRTAEPMRRKLFRARYPALATDPLAPAPAPPPGEAAPAQTSADPSFNCADARTPGEIAVCSDPRLAALDRRMAAQFSERHGRREFRSSARSSAGPAILPALS